jgi:1-acyl-sn-glycerol-3-phosphate acyltransferase
MGFVQRTSAISRVSALLAQFIMHASFQKRRIKDPRARQDFFIKNMSVYGAKFLEHLHVDVKVTGLNRERLQNQNFLFIGNHMSYLEVLALSAQVPSIFVTSVDMGETKLIGTLAELVGAIFVERRNRKQIAVDLKKITQALKDGYNVVVYPEGTTGNGEALLPFKTSLLNAALEAHKDIWPVCARYLEFNGEPFAMHNRDKLCWAGDTTFGQHITGLLTSDGSKIELEFLEPIKVTADSDRHDLAKQAFAMLTEAYGQPLKV